MFNRGVTVSRACALEFRVPPTSGASGATGTSSEEANVIVTLQAPSRAGTLDGIGEASLRSRRMTGDDLEQSWRFIQTALAELEGAVIPSRLKAARAEVGTLIEHIRGLAGDDDTDTAQRRRYRGAMAGLDIAVTDLAAKAAGVSLAAFFGAEREQRLEVSAAPIRMRRSGDEMERRIKRQLGRYPMTKIVGLHSVEEASDALLRAAAIHRSAGVVRPLWLDLAGRLDFEDAAQIVDSAVSAVRAGTLAPHVVLEQPVGRRDRRGLVELQRRADAGADGLEAPGIVVMADESVWSRAQLRELCVHGSVRGVSLNLQRLGGTHRVLTLARELWAQSPQTRVCLTSVPRTSAVAWRALLELGVALPRLDYFAVPPAHAEGVPVIEPSAGFDQDNVLRAGMHVGIDAKVLTAASIESIGRRVTFPRRSPASGSGGAPVANRFDAEVRRSAGLPELNSYLLERAVLAHGPLRLVRFSPITFVAEHADLDKPFGFEGTMSDATGRVSRVIAGDEELARKVLRGSRVPVEGHLDGERCRFLVVGGEVVSAVLRKPAAVVGDGSSTVLDLVLGKNEERLSNPYFRDHLIKMDSDTQARLSRRGLSLDSVPAKDSEMSVASLVTDAPDTVEVLDETDERVLVLASRAAAALSGLDAVQVDCVLPDHRSWDQQRSPVVVGIDAAPDVAYHQFPCFGEPRDVAGAIVSARCGALAERERSGTSGVTVDIEIAGKVQGVGYRAWLVERARELGVAGSVRNLSSGSVAAVISGTAEDVCALTASAIIGPKNALPVHTVLSLLEGARVTGEFEVGA